MMRRLSHLIAPVIAHLIAYPIILLGLVGILCLLPLSAYSLDRVKVSIAGGYEEINAYSERDVVYVSLSGLAEILGGTVDWEIVGHKVVYSDADFRVEYLVGSSFLKLNDSLYNMTYPASLRKGQLYIPAATGLPLLDRVVWQKITWQPGQRTIQVESEYFNVTDLSVQPKANGLLLEVFTNTALSYEVFVTEGNWLNISIRDAKINRNRILSRKDSRLMYDLKVHQVENNTGQISIRLKRDIQKWHHKIEYDPTRIQISITDINFELDTTAKPVIGPDKKIDVIVIDAGHGGKDYGAIGGGGTREKDVVLEIAKRLANLIRRDKQFKVIMTRDRDKWVSLEDRAKIANEAGADLFVSIHANASAKKAVRGWNVFFLAPARNDSARAVEQLENSFFLREAHQASAGDGDSFSADPVLSILNEMIMTEFQTESHDFANMVDREFRRFLKTPARGIDQAGFFVLNNVFTPSVLVETAFISNQAEEKLLKSKGYQDDIAKGLYDAIKRFKAKYESD